MSEIGNGHVRIERDGRRADVIIARPEKRNAMNEATVADPTAAIEEVDADNDVRAATLLGEGSVFCAGFQLEMMHEKDVADHDEFHSVFRELLDTIDETTTPSSRDQRGGDRRRVRADSPSRSPRAGRGGEVRHHRSEPWHLSPPGIHPAAPADRRAREAKELVLTGDYIDPEEAAQCNPVTEVVPGENVDDRARELADELTEKAPLGIQNALEAFQATFDVPLEDGLSTEHRLAMQVYGTRDRKEGFEAQLEGRDAEFEGR